MSPEVYRHLPVMTPFALRDPQSRGDRRRQIPDQWGSPNADGFFRDDNSLIKGLPRSLPVNNPGNHLYHGKRIGTGFVACHVWRRLVTGDLASRDPNTYSFVPNLIWLPAQVAALTDREGSFAQAYLQALSYKIYERTELTPEAATLVRSIWFKLPAPDTIPPEGLPDVESLNFFQPNAPWFNRRRATVRRVIEALSKRVAHQPSSHKVISRRYTAGIQNLDIEAAKSLRSALLSYVDIVDSSYPNLDDVKPSKTAANLHPRSP